MKYPPTTQFALIAASSSDIPTLIRIHIDAFSSDNCSRLLYKDNVAREKALRAALEFGLTHPRQTVMKAVKKDTDTGKDEILGWLGCGWYGYSDSDSNSNPTPSRIDDVAKPLLQAQDANPLQEVIRTEFINVLKEWMSGKKFLYIGTLVAAPLHQNRGVGTALMRWAIQEADGSGIPCWLQSSPVGHSLYYKLGFRDVGSLELDLSEFIGGREGKAKDKGIKSGWGVFEYRHMLRLAEG